MKRRILILAAALVLTFTTACACATSGPDETCEVATQ
jgi:hypothetical protein